MPDFDVVPLEQAPRLLLCSDGVTGMIDDDEVERILLATAAPGEAAQALVDAAVAAGGRDNATAVVVDVVGLTTTQTGADTGGAAPHGSGE